MVKLQLHIIFEKKDGFWETLQFSLASWLGCRIFQSSLTQNESNRNI